MTIRIIRLETAKSGSKRTLAGGWVEPGESVQLTANVPLDDPACRVSVGHGATEAHDEILGAKFTDETDSSQTVWLPRDKAASYLGSVGCPMSEQRLAKLAVFGDGPESCCWEGHEFYEVTQLIEWTKGWASTPGRTAHHPMT